MESFKQSVFLYLNAPADAGALALAVARFLAEDLIWLVPAGLLFGWMFGGDGVRRAVLQATVAGVMALACAQIIGVVWLDPRPFMIGLGHTYMVHAPDASFPSGHLTLWRATSFSADITLLEKSLMVLVQGVIEGRKTFSNMLKYIRMTASSNFGNVFSVLVASAFLPFLPMLLLQLLVQNLLYDVSQVAIPFDNVDDELVKLPLTWNPGDIARFMVFFGPISSVFDIVTFGLM